MTRAAGSSTRLKRLFRPPLSIGISVALFCSFRFSFQFGNTDFDVFDFDGVWSEYSNSCLSGPSPASNGSYGQGRTIPLPLVGSFPASNPLDARITVPWNV